MRHIFLTLGLLIPLLSFAQETSALKEYSYTELVDMIQAEEDTIFRLSDAKIFFEPTTDSLFLINRGDTRYTTVDKGLRKDTLHIKKVIDLRNVEFEISIINKGTRMWVGFSKVKFHKQILLSNPRGLVISESKFEEGLLFGQEPDLLVDLERGFNDYIYINESEFSGPSINLYLGENNQAFFTFNKNIVEIGDFGLFNRGHGSQDFNSNQINAEHITLVHEFSSSQERASLEMLNNTLIASHPLFVLNTSNLNSVQVAKNKWQSTYVSMDIDDFTAKSIWFKWDQFQEKVIDSRMFRTWMKPEGLSPFARNGFIPETKKLNRAVSTIYTDRNVNYYIDTVRIQDVDVFNAEQALKGKFYDFYKGRHDISAANAVYIEIKDLETQRLKYLYEESPSFKTYFKWRINQFLKIFSAYGTEPERAIVFSVWVILAFALVYLFFPNHWDSHGKDRILHRYQFFFKYLNKDAGMHDVYLDGKKDELAHYDGFKNFFIENGKTVPKFFLATALPLYRWSTASTRSSSWFLRKIDIFKGKWADLPAPQRAAKTVLLTLAFAIALTYDILIKMLNALMLSINTFTTLGFGEIPIKGLPRYLAIVQGFIGWFMLTIFSVSLISQLLN